jgi:histidyl-tRNA synthetase
MAGENNQVPFAVILGDDELKEGLVTVKEQKWQFVDGKKVLQRFSRQFKV